MKATRVDGLPLLSGPRRFWIGDLMAAVALAALGMTLAVLVDRSDMMPGERTAFAVIAALVFLMLYCQWPLSNLRAGDMHSWRSALLGFVSMALALATMTCVALLTIALAEGAALVIIMMLSVAIYLTTWD
jgi:hypothetical protein